MTILRRGTYHFEGRLADQEACGRHAAGEVLKPVANGGNGLDLERRNAEWWAASLES